MHAPKFRPVVVLTDLCEEWHILWMDGMQPSCYSNLQRAHAIPLLRNVVQQARLYDLQHHGTPIPGSLRSVIEMAQEGSFKRLFKRQLFGRVWRGTMYEGALGQPVAEGVSCPSETFDGHLAKLVSLRGMMGSVEEEQRLACDINQQVVREIDGLAGLTERGIW